MARPPGISRKSGWETEVSFAVAPRASLASQPQSLSVYADTESDRRWGADCGWLVRLPQGRTTIKVQSLG